MTTNFSRASARTGRVAWIAVVAAAGLTLAACDNRQSSQSTSVGEKVDSAVVKTEQAAKNGMEQARDSMSSATATAKNAGEKAVAVIDDSAITAAVSAGLAKDPDLSALRVDVDTKAGVVTLTGPAPNSTAKDRASKIALDVKGVNAVNNQLVVKPT